MYLEKMPPILIDNKIRKIPEFSQIYDISQMWREGLMFIYFVTIYTRLLAK